MRNIGVKLSNVCYTQAKNCRHNQRFGIGEDGVRETELKQMLLHLHHLHHLHHHHHKMDLVLHRHYAVTNIEYLHGG